MAAERKVPEAQVQTPAGGQPKIVWDDSNMHSVYANVGNAAGTREEIVLLPCGAEPLRGQEACPSSQ
jgi:hypothetical protein